MEPIYTKRLMIKEFSVEDADDMYEYAKVPVIGYSAGWEPHKSVAESKEIIKLMIKEKEALGIYLNNKLIGSLGIHLKNNEYYLGYVLSKDFWNFGYMTEACIALLKKYFSNENNKVLYASTFIENIKSQNVLKKLGFEYYKDTKIKVFNEEKMSFVFKLEKDKFIKENENDNFK